MPAITLYTDEKLLELMSSDNEDAFSTIYRRYWQGLFVTAARALRGKDEAADVVQEVFLSLWNRRKELKIEGSLAAYLQTSARYKAIHYIEKNITRRDYLSKLVHSTASDICAAGELQIQFKEVQQTVVDAIEKMPPRMREIYNLSRHEHLTHRQIAQILNISEETVKKQIQYALRLIKSALRYHRFTLPILIHYIFLSR
ncbi:RNA polymerase sigma factor [Chitinophaga eiseniae]|uniref:RNA polymerase sigma-70 factor n=1 Tax=Chitinophaga eiseniae TaxID=634771 RepID=A0A847SCY6_9BACT|nr:RNA polymerase sigma-70 factor [Chitinophaga eiseniae]NLR79661.1 RNA polymerase sigma-70 factor [Chitinophaga eiseniae]